MQLKLKPGLVLDVGQEKLRVEIRDMGEKLLEKMMENSGTHDESPVSNTNGGKILFWVVQKKSVAGFCAPQWQVHRASQWLGSWLIWCRSTSLQLRVFMIRFSLNFMRKKF